MVTRDVFARWCARVLALAAVALSVVACGGGGGGGSPGGGGTPSNPALERFDAGFFSVQKPRGWTVITAGGCGTFAFLVRDPADPLRQIFYFGSIGPVYTDARQKALDEWYVSHGGFNLITWLDAPVIDPLTPESFMAHWPEIAAMKAATAFMSQFPRLEGLKLVSSTTRPNLLPNATTGESRGLFTLGGRVGEGMFLVSVLPYFPYNPNLPSPGTINAYGHFVCGVTTPKAEFPASVDLLVASIDSFTITQAYVDGCLRQSAQQWGAVAQAGQTLREASDILWEGWQARTHVQDIMAEQYRDGFLGVERVYDPATGTVYEVGVGWYQDYLNNLGNYQMKSLVPLPSSDYALWMAPLTPGSQIH